MDELIDELTALEALKALRKPFPAKAHKQRKLRGGGQFIYIPYNTVVERLNEVCPLAWEVDIDAPTIVGDDLIVGCRLTLFGMSRKWVGTVEPFPPRNEANERKIIGTPPDNATALAFMRACRLFGIGAYVKNQDWLREYYLEGEKYRAKLNRAMSALNLTTDEIKDLCADNFDGADPLELSSEEGDRLIKMMEMLRTAKMPEPPTQTQSTGLEPSVRKALNDARKRLRLSREQIEAIAKDNGFDINTLQMGQVQELVKKLEEYAKT